MKWSWNISIVIILIRTQPITDDAPFEASDISVFSDIGQGSDTSQELELHY